MHNDTSFLGLIVGLLFLVINTILIVGAGTLIYHHFRPHPSWINTLNTVWLLIVICAGMALAFLVFRNFLLPYERWQRVSTYVINIALSPCIVAGVVALFFKP
jgi:hypothetical protein